MDAPSQKNRGFLWYFSRISAVVLIGCLIAIAAIWLTSLFEDNALEITVNRLYAEIDDGLIKEIAIDSNTVRGVFADGREFVTTVVNTSEVEQAASRAGVKVSVIPAKSAWWWIFWVVGILVAVQIALFIIGILYSRREQKRSATAAFTEAMDDEFAKKIIVQEKPDVTFDDIAGYEEVKEEVMEIAEILKDPERCKKMGAKLPNGILFVGPPGVGKTLFAKAMAREINHTFIAISGSELEEVFVGVGAKRVRALYALAEKKAPAIVFIDEFDAAGRRRISNPMDGASVESNQTLSELLNKMGGLREKGQIITVTATNCPEGLDPAAIRSGRIDRKIVFDSPDVRTREKILKVHTRNKPLDASVDLAEVAKSTFRYTGADLEVVCNEAALLAIREKRETIGQKMLMEGVKKVVLGPARKNRSISQKEKEITAYHEAGHSVVAVLLPEADKPREVTILGRGPTGGANWFVSNEEMHLESKTKLLAQLAVGMGGRAAETLIFKDESSGASGDFQSATNIVKKMVREYGMSEKVGRRNFGSTHKFLGMFSNSGDQLSEETLRLIDSEEKRLLEEAYERAYKLISENVSKLEAVAKALLEKETLEGKEVKEIMASV